MRRMRRSYKTRLGSGQYSGRRLPATAALPSSLFVPVPSVQTGRYGAGLFLVWRCLDTEIMRRSFQYYEKSPLTIHPFPPVCSASSLHSWDLMKRRLIISAIRLNLICSTRTATPRMGCTRPTWAAVTWRLSMGSAVYACTKIELILIPNFRGGWTGYGFQITYRGSGIHVQVETGRSRFRLTSGMPAMIRSMVKNTNSGGTNLLSNISCKD